MPNLRLIPLLQTLTIQTKDASTEKFDIRPGCNCQRADCLRCFAWAQRTFVSEIEAQYNRGQAVRIMVLKARQLGISTAMEATLFWWGFLHHNTNGLVVAHENDSTFKLFEKTQKFWDTWDFNELFTAKHASQRRLSWVETGSDIHVATAKNVRAGRSQTLHTLHASECAFYPDPETLMGGLNQSIPNKHGTIIVRESTANGIGNWFHTEWLKAEEGESDYKPLFFPWYKHPEYRQATTLTVALECDAVERALLRLGADFENIQWRRWAIRNLCNYDENLFMQEYPATPIEAFLTTGSNVFPGQLVDNCYQQLQGHRGRLIGDEHGHNPRWVPDPGGPLYIFKAPIQTDIRQDRYFVGGDPSQTVAGDPACIQVINRGTMEQVAVWHGQIDPINFAREMMLLGRYYHNAMLCPEAEGGGQAAVGYILASDYPQLWQHRWADKAPGKVGNQYGWATNFNRKNWAVSQLRYLLGDTSITLHDLRTYNQLRNYVVLENGEMGPADPKMHDDAVMALAITVTASIAEGPFIERPPDDLLTNFEDYDEEGLDAVPLPVPRVRVSAR